jgi:hypothetical protein
VHGAENKDTISENKDGQVKAIFVLGGYIYPAGVSIMHDPMLEVGGLQLDISPEVGNILIITIIGVLIIGAMVMTGAVLVRHKMKNRNDRSNKVPPPYRP